MIGASAYSLPHGLNSVSRDYYRPATLMATQTTRRWREDRRFTVVSAPRRRRRSQDDYEGGRRTRTYTQKLSRTEAAGVITPDVRRRPAISEANITRIEHFSNMMNSRRTNSCSSAHLNAVIIPKQNSALKEETRLINHTCTELRKVQQTIWACANKINQLRHWETSCFLGWAGFSVDMQCWPAASDVKLGQTLCLECVMYTYNW